jgi:FADH2-dependent halogenase
MQSEYDVAIIGGGPAGSTAAILLARAGRRVVVIEREKFPRFHIGESLLPYSMVAFDRLGIREELEKTAFDKRGGEVATACGSRAVKFHFVNGFRLKHTRSYQVERAQLRQTPARPRPRGRR